MSIKYALAAFFGSWYLRLLRWTWRLDEQPQRLVTVRRRPEGEGPGTIYALWHSRILVSAATQGWQGAHVLISIHGDGEYIARAVERIGFRTIRGSTSRGGIEALRNAVKVLRAGGDVALTPDGPRGPRMRVQVGCVLMAMKSGAPIVPVAFECRRGRRLKSWDRFLVPSFFNRVHVRFGEPLVVPKGTQGEELEQYRALVEQKLVDLTRETAEGLGVAPETPDVDPRPVSA